MASGFTCQGVAVFEERQLTQVFALLSAVAEALAAVVPPACEVTVLDLRTPGYNVVRRLGPPLGAAPGDLAALVGDEPEAAPHSARHDVAVQVVASPAGRDIVSARVKVRDFTGHVVGALIVTCDYSDLMAARELLQRLTPGALTDHVESEMGKNGPAEEYVERVVRAALLERRKPLHTFDREDRVAVIRMLDRAGVFAMRRAVNVVADELGISRTSIYSYLREARHSSAGEPLAGDSPVP
jgi:predicted transcriptional regulator YheO